MNADTPGRLAGVRDDDDDVVVVLPLFHVFRLSSQHNVCVRFGATMSLVPRFDATKVREVMQRDGVTVFEGVPTSTSRCRTTRRSRITTCRGCASGSPAARRSPPRSSTPPRRSSAS